MADEFSRPTYNLNLAIPQYYNCDSLVSKRGAELETHYKALLRELSKVKGILVQIYAKSQNKIHTLPSCRNSLT